MYQNDKTIHKWMQIPPGQYPLCNTMEFVSFGNDRAEVEVEVLPSVAVVLVLEPQDRSW